MAEEMVMIACKAPNGVVLDTDRYERTDQTSWAIRTIVGERFTLKGWAHGTNKPDPAVGTGGYVLTPVPAAFWAKWLATHADFPLLEDKTILGPNKDARGQAIDHAAVPKMFDYANPKGVAGIEKLNTAE